MVARLLAIAHKSRVEGFAAALCRIANFLERNKHLASGMPIAGFGKNLRGVPHAYAPPAIAAVGRFLDPDELNDRR